MRDRARGHRGRLGPQTHDDSCGEGLRRANARNRATSRSSRALWGILESGKRGKSSSRTVVAVLRRRLVGQGDGGCLTCVSFAQSHVPASMLEGEDRHVIRFGGGLWPGQAGRRDRGRRAGISGGDVCFPRQRGGRRLRSRHARQTAERAWALRVGGSRKRPVDR